MAMSMRAANTAERGVLAPASAVEGAGGHVTGKETAGDVGQALADELLVAVQVLAGAGRQGAGDGHRLGEGEQGHGEGRRRQILDGGEGQIRGRQRRQAGGQGAHGADAGITEARLPTTMAVIM